MATANKKIMMVTWVHCLQFSDILKGVDLVVCAEVVFGSAANRLWIAAQSVQQTRHTKKAESQPLLHSYGFDLPSITPCLACSRLTIYNVARGPYLA